MIKSAIDKVDGIVRQANETQRVMENLTKIEQIQEKLDIVCVSFKLNVFLFFLTFIILGIRFKTFC